MMGASRVRARGLSLLEMLVAISIMAIALAMLYKAIASLPEQKRVVCMLKMEGTLTNQEIADKLNISINTVKTHYLQSIQKLKECMSKMLIFLFFITHLLLICVNLYTIG